MFRLDPGDSLAAGRDLLVRGDDRGLVLVDGSGAAADVLAESRVSAAGLVEHDREMTSFPLAGAVLFAHLTEHHARCSEVVLGLGPPAAGLLSGSLRAGEPLLELSGVLINGSDLGSEVLQFTCVVLATLGDLLDLRADGPFVAHQAFQIGIEPALVVLEIDDSVHRVTQLFSDGLLAFPGLGGLGEQRAQFVVHAFDLGVHPSDFAPEVLHLQTAGKPSVLGVASCVPEPDASGRFHDQAGTCDEPPAVASHGQGGLEIVDDRDVAQEPFGGGTGPVPDTDAVQQGRRTRWGGRGGRGAPCVGEHEYRDPGRLIPQGFGEMSEGGVVRDQKQFEVASEDGFHPGGIVAAGRDGVPEHAVQAGVIVDFGQDPLDGFGQALARLLHLLQEVESRAEARPLVSGIPDAVGELSMLLAERRSRVVVIGQQGLEAGHFSPGGVETAVVLVAIGSQRGPFGFDRGLAMFEAFQLLVESTHASFDGGAGGLEMGPPGQCPFPFAADRFGCTVRQFRFLMESGHVAAEGVDLAFGLRQLFAGRGHGLGGGPQVVVVASDLVFEFGELRSLVLELGPGLLELAGRHVPTLGGVGDGGFELLPPLDAGLGLVLQLVPGEFVFLLRGIQLQGPPLQIGSLGIQVGQPAGQPGQPDPEIVVLIQDQFPTKGGVFVVEFTEATGLHRLAPDDAETPLGAGQLLADTHQVDLGPFQLPGGFDLSRLELGDAGGFLQDRPSFDGVAGQHRVDLALLDDRVGIGTDAGVHEEFLDVAKTAGLAVEQVVASSVTEQSAAHVDGLGVDGEGPALRRIPGGGVDHGVLEGEGDGGGSERLAPRGSGEDDVRHGLPAQALGGSFAKDPFDGIHDVRFTAAIGTDDPDLRLVEADFDGVCERFETGD